MPFGSDIIYSALNVSAVTDTIDTYLSSPAIFDDVLQPSNFTGSGINYYLQDQFNAAEEYEDYTYIINCRADSYSQSQTIAAAVVDSINRTHYTDSFITCQVLTTITPLDSTDNYNTPVTANLKKR